MEGTEIERILREEIFDVYCPKYHKIGIDETMLPVQYFKYARAIKDFSIYDSDIIVTSYPKSGTTWTQEMVWMIANNLDFKGAQKDIIIRFPCLEYCLYMDWDKMDKNFNSVSPPYCSQSIDFINKMDKPRFIQTHLPVSLLPDGIRLGIKSPKIIYVMRNPKDLCISYCHYGNILQRWRTNPENFAKVFMTGEALYGSYWKHVFGFWTRRHDPNVLIIKYEDMKADLPLVIRKVARFLNKNLSEEQVHILAKHLSFESMKNNKAVNSEKWIELERKRKLTQSTGNFIRSGVVGKYKQELSPEAIQVFDNWIKKNVEGTDFGKQYNYNW